MWGDTGAGKTTLALSFPGVALIDAEGGAEQYSDRHQFSVLDAADPDEVMDAVTFLQTAAHPYKTFVLDPFTVYWEALQKKYSDIFLQRNTGSRGHRYDYYDIQFRDWNVIKSELRHFYRRVLALDMNIIFTAREKPQYADGDFLRRTGETFDGEKSLPYLFDVVLRLGRENGAFRCEIIKDRGQRLGERARFSAQTPEGLYRVIEKAYGREHLTRQAEPTRTITPAQKDRIQELIRRLNIPESKVQAALQAHGALRFDDLAHEEANTVIQRLETRLERVDEKKHAKKATPLAV